MRLSDLWALREDFLLTFEREDFRADLERDDSMRVLNPGETSDDLLGFDDNDLRLRALVERASLIELLLVFVGDPCL